MRRKTAPRPAASSRIHRSKGQQVSLPIWAKSFPGVALVLAGCTSLLALISYFVVNLGSSDSRPGLFLVAAPVDYMSVPGFLVAARSFAERASDKLVLRFAVLTDDLAWTELQGSCECYLPQETCKSFIRVPSVGSSDDSGWRVPRTRSAASRSLSRWNHASQAQFDRHVLLSLASCKRLKRLGAPKAVLILPDPHVLATGDPASFLQQTKSINSGAPYAVLSGGGLSAGERVGGGADAGVLLVHGERWRALEFGGYENMCPISEDGAPGQARIRGPRQEGVSILEPKSLAQAGVTVGSLEGIGTWYEQGGAEVGSLSGSVFGTVPPPQCRTWDAGGRDLLLLRIADRIKPWEGGDKPGDALEPGATESAAPSCDPTEKKGWLSLRQEARRLLECRYPLRPGMRSVDYERHQYTYYYRYFRHWFQPGPVRPGPDEAAASIRDVRDPVTPTGLRFTDLVLRMGQFDGQKNYAVFADKISVKHYARVVLGEGYTVGTLGAVIPASARDFRPPVAGLTDYALKASSVAGTNAILKDGKMVFCESSFIASARKLGMGGCKGKVLGGPLYDAVVGWVHRATHRLGREKQYEDMRKAMILEELYDGDNIPADYKFFCSRGRVMFLKEVAGRYSKDGKKKRGYYLPDWTWLPDVFQQALMKPAEEPGPPPAKLAEMVQVAQRLSEPFPFVRVDLFEVNGRVYVGEMTFTPTSAEKLIEPPQIEAIMGRILGQHLPQPAPWDGWDSGLRAPAGQVLSQEQVTEAMLPLTVKSPDGGPMRDFLEWKRREDVKKKERREAAKRRQREKNGEAPPAVA